MKKRVLLVVESPSKAKTIQSYLGEDYRVLATYGHTQDLPSHVMGVDIKNSFHPEFEIIQGKEKILRQLLKEARISSSVILATDPDREGEAIAFHIKNFLQESGVALFQRITLKEISKKALKKELQNPGKLNLDLVEAQLARRIIDRLMGYSVSPLLWDIRSGLSAGRVQSTVLKWICDRQKEIEEFATEEYYEVSAELREGLLFLLVEPVDTSLKTLHLSSQKQVEDIIKDLNKLEKNETEVKLKVVDIQSEKKTRYPPPPFTTSTLQQEAYRRLKFPANKTMLLAQKLYEGVDIAGEGRLGFITYMRTDSVRISEEAALKRRIYIEKQFGKVFIGLMQRKSKKGNIQDAHEAIRPVSISREPKNYTNKLPKDLLDLYKLIWERFVVSGMAAEQSVEYKYLSKRKDYYFLNKQKEVVFEGFTVFTGENKKKEKPHHLEKGKEYVVEKFFWEKKNTEAPIPFTEATIIRKMESSGVGRPSTYASSLNVLFKRKYIRKEKNYLLPEELGLLVNTRLCENFIEFIDEKFTASIEKKLDLVEMKKLERLQLIKDFYSSLQKCLVQTKKKPFTTKKNNLESEPEKKNLCPLCNKGEIKVKNTGRGKKYQQCSRFPHCEFMEYI